MAPSTGSVAPPVPGVDFAAGPTALWFYKVTCPVCQMSAPVAHVLADAYPGRFVGIGQDPDERLRSFDREYGLGFDSMPDLPPFPVSDAYGIEVVPTMVVVGTDGTVLDSVWSWDREGYARVAESLSNVLHMPPPRLEPVTAGLPAFRPG
jgi:hypothetical protein